MAAKLYGTLVGQPYQNIVATGFGMIPNRYKDGTDQVLWRDTVALNGNLIGDQISLAILKSSAYIDQGNSFLWFGACGTGCTINIGDVNHANALGAALSLAAAGSASIEPAFVPGWIAYPLWQRLGYASDPGGNLELLATFAGANPANVNMSWQICGRNS